MPQRFPYVEVDPILGAASSLPYAPITLQLGDRKVQVSGLIDSAERVNDFETPARQIYCRVVAAVFGLGVDFQVG